ncbi:MAG: IS66 family transposase, partial [Planctomycetes bacterium]|nr:IS66 family transposase [Planctomycetota bacterium]
MTPEQARAIYRAGEATVVRMLCELSRQLDKLRADLAVLKAENASLRSECQLLRGTVQSLEEKAAKDSHNSNKPPSSDGLGKPKPKSLRRPSQRPSGGQPGHPGHTLRMVEKPDRTVCHTVERCASCGRSLRQQPPDCIERRQVFELPEPKLEVTEHQSEVKTCPCGHVNCAGFPLDVTAPVQYGPRIKSVAVYLKEYQLLPSARLSEIMRDVFACESFSEGTLHNFSAACSRALEPVDAVIRDLAVASDVAGFDETGLRALGSLHWLHTVSTRWLTTYHAHKRRGCEAMDAANILPRFRGRAVHDFWESYLKYDCRHAFCNGHLLRELIFLWEEQGQKWAKSMIDHLLKIKEAVDTTRNAGSLALPGADIKRFLNRFERIVAAGYAQNPL